ncbi:MAG: hypothetical protein HY655_04660, partial [Acidobacteria bacterium]|nr:hypothetical protein [Acidobacteriota bacterium]
MVNRMQRSLLVVAILAGFGIFAAAQTAKPGAQQAARNPRVFFIEPLYNATVSSPVHMKFGSV